MKVSWAGLLACVLAVSISAQAPSPTQAGKFDNKHPPRFEDFPVSENWNQSAAPLELTTRSERMFRTNLTNAAKQPPNFAGHYRFTFWGCGSNCGAGALIDLQTGKVFPPPLASHGNGWDRWIMSPGFFEDSGVDFRVESRLVIVRNGMNYSERLQKNVPDKHYFLWEQNAFRLLYFSGKASGK